MTSPSPATDGYYHPTSEDEIVALVRHASRSGTPLRVIGSGHSEWAAIQPGFVPPGAAGGGRPPAGMMLLMLDRFRSVTFHDDGGRVVVEADAGVNLGRDPYCTTHKSSWKDSLCWQVMERGLSLPDLGAISHHTVSGFIATGSLGGSARHSFFDALERIRFVDAAGTVHDLDRSDERFYAAGVSMGLFGVITKVWLRCEPSYNLVGRELRKPIDATPIDFFGEGPNGRVPFSQYMRELDYVRAVWWPQRKFEYVALFEATRVEPVPAFEPVRYELLAPDTRMKSLLAALLLTFLGNLNQLSQVTEKLRFWFEKLDEELDDDPDDNACRSPSSGGARPITRADILEHLRMKLRASGAGDAGGALERLWDDTITNGLVWLLEKAMDGSLGLADKLHLGKLVERVVPPNIQRIVSLFVEDGDSRFQDCWLCGLAIDDQLDDRLWPLRFMELSIPLDRAEAMMRTLRDYFRADGDPAEAYARTGPFACQVYPGKKSDFWLSPAYGTDVVRFDGFWYSTLAGDPRDQFFRGIWERLEPFGFRPHWGKVLPSPPRKWAAYYERQL
ncbi:MAG: FAD-binding protein, partial [Myxococcales bacterium]|nr:FAD-binding protein [Myxococcales bacterium]